MRALKEIFITPEYNEKIFSILENKILFGKESTGRRGMDLWHIFVLAQVRLGLNTNYDRLETMANGDHVLRSVMLLRRTTGSVRFCTQHRSIASIFIGGSCNYRQRLTN